VPPVHSLSPSSVATAPAPLSPLSLHDALPISRPRGRGTLNRFPLPTTRLPIQGPSADRIVVCIPFLCTRENSYSSSALSHAAKRSEEHTSELQSRENLVCRLLLEKKKNTINAI